MERLYILGHPVAHSKSPAMHNAAYEALGLKWEYGFMDRATELSARAFLLTPSWRACNITMPWKPLAFDVAGVRSPEAQLARGANVLVNWAGRLHADNTDGKGCVSYLQRCGVDFKDARVAVCGTGPTSLAIFHACLMAGAEHAALLGRDDAKARAIVSDYWVRSAERGCEPLGEFEGASYQAGEQHLLAADVIIDATPLGMSPDDPAPFDTALLSAHQVVFDVVYGHGETALLSAARQRGCEARDGAGMLVAQAVETVRDIADITGAFAIPAHMDLFSIMARAANFDL